ncbi:MAG TPA: HAMP domain-containing sensor histidine kinase, partial [Elusimicrobiota bacterium]|nr:HAMP domain-containing sensor histidine kinase [Elusimicrobiota bacterium]
FNLMAERLAELDELKDGFLAQITHDLRNPLAAAMGRIELLLKGYQGSLTDEQKESLAMAMTSAVFLNELITNILDLTKLEAGKMELHPQLLDLSACAASVTGMLQVKADEYGVALDVSGIPAGALVWADEQGLRRVLTNLVSNALKFTPKGGGVRLRWSRLPDGRDRVSVEDTGIGIPKAKLDTLFKKFSQVEETKKAARSPGTGLGLAICKQLVEGHGGTVGVESEYRRGTTFYFELPAGRLAGERSIG